MLNVLHLINYPGRAGSERYILSLAEKLHNKKCRVYLAYCEEGPMISRLKELGIEVFNIPMRSPYDFKAAKELKNLCRRLNIDVVHTHFLRENYISIFSKIMGNRVVLVNTNHVYAKKNFLVSLSNSFLNLFVDRTIAVCNSLKEQVTAMGLNHLKVEVIHNGVDVECWKGKRNLKIRRELGIGRGDFVVTSVSRFTEEKGHIFLLESIKELKKIVESNMDKFLYKVRFVLIGEGELLDECKEFARISGIGDDVIFTGYLPDIKDILHGSDLYVSHSVSQTPGYSMLEALACGLPVVATNSGGPAEIISGENDCGIVVNNGDAENFAKAIAALITDREIYLRYRKNAVRTVKEKFNLDRSVEETYNLYIRSLTAGF